MKVGDLKVGHVVNIGYEDGSLLWAEVTGEGPNYMTFKCLDVRHKGCRFIRPKEDMVPKMREGGAHDCEECG